MLNKVSFIVTFFLTIVFVNAQTLTPKVTVTPASQNINPGQSATVRIQTIGVDKCTITGEPYNNFNIIKNGNILLRPNKTTEYTFDCKDVAGKVVASTKAKITLVTINQPVAGSLVQPSSPTSQAGLQSNPLSQLSSPLGQQTSQPRPQPTQYSTQTLQSAANELCSKYSNYKSVYDPVTAAGGVSSVPVDLAQLAQYLIDINRETKLTADEIRQQNLLRYCTEYFNMARATARLAETSAKSIKTIADNCYADEKCMRDRVYKADLEKEIKAACNSDSSDYLNRQKCELVQLIDKPAVKSSDLSDVEQKKKCADLYAQGFWARECIMLKKPFDELVDSYYAAKDNIEQGQNDLTRAFAKSDVMGARPCIETASGRSPEEVRFYEADCIRYRQEPSIINEEVLRQITSLPYTQAFSPSSVLGYDGVLDNINTRAREGNLIDPNISPSFGSSAGGTGGGGGVAGTNDLSSVEGNYKKIATNIGVIVQLYDVARLAYASSTSVCKALPITTRRSAITKIDDNKRTYVDYLTTLKQMWDAAIAKPRENHSDLIVKINFDLKDKYNQTEIDKVYDAVKKLLQTCVDARGTS